MLDAGTYTPAAFHTGYTDVLGAQLRVSQPGLKVVNLSCPGESTTTMIDGPCGFSAPAPDGAGLALHVPYAGTQLHAAVDFVRRHPGKVALITLAIGSNDVDEAYSGCKFKLACIAESAVAADVQRNLRRILGALTAADAGAEIVLIPAYDASKIDHPRTDRYWHRDLVAVTTAVARRFHARVADLSAAMNSKRDLCSLTYVCASGDDHPTDAGYARIAELIRGVAGNAR